MMNFPVNDFANPISSLKRELKRITHRVNILVFGKIGRGKSSFISTLQLAFNPSIQQNELAKSTPPGSELAGSTFTRNFDFFNLKDTNIYLADTYGWETNPSSGDNYSIEAFGSYLLGEVQQGQKLPTNGQINRVARNKLNQIDALIFFLPADWDEEHLRNMWEGMKKYYEVAKKSKVSIIFVLSHVDLVMGPVLGGNANVTLRNVTQHSTFAQDLVAKARQALGGIMEPFLPLFTYQHSQMELFTKNSAIPSVEEFALSALLRALKKDLEPVPYWTSNNMIKNETILQPNLINFHREEPDD